MVVELFLRARLISYLITFSVLDCSPGTDFSIVLEKISLEQMKKHRERRDRRGSHHVSLPCTDPTILVLASILFVHRLLKSH